jgi:hypothetical protein
LCQALGVEPERENITRERPIKLAEGTPIADILV